MKQKYLWMVRRAFRALRHPRLRHRGWWKRMTKPLMERKLWVPCRDTVATGLAVGLFFGLMPIPFQSICAGTIAMWFRSNVPIAMVATFLSNPLTNIPIWAAQLWLGKWIQDHVSLPGMEVPDLGSGHVAQFLLGAGISGLVAGMMAFPLVHLFSAIMPHHLPRRQRQRGVIIVPARDPENSGS